MDTPTVIQEAVVEDPAALSSTLQRTMEIASKPPLGTQIVLAVTTMARLRRVGFQVKYTLKQHGMRMDRRQL
jgi:hypothetical protein